MKNTPILMSGPLVRAVLSGLKTQTRRPLKIQPDTIIESPVLTRMQPGYPDGARPIWEADGEPNVASSRAAFGSVGDRLWVRETWRPWMEAWSSGIEYAADSASIENKLELEDYEKLKKVALRFSGANKDVRSEAWHPSIHMPRKASRIDLEITDIRVERVQDASPEDILAEGIASDQWSRAAIAEEGITPETAEELRVLWRRCWSEIYGPESWTSNPWVWAVSFKRVQQ